MPVRVPCLLLACILTTPARADDVPDVTALPIEPGRAGGPAPSGEFPTAETAVPAAGGPLTLADLEALALRHNPTIEQSAARIEQARGRAVQAGLYPNPLIVYDQNGINTDGTAGEPGTFIQQPIVTGGKLRANRARYEVDVAIARQQLLHQQIRVLTGVRLRYLQMLALEDLLRLRGAMTRIADDVVRVAERKREDDHASEADVLMARQAADRALVEANNLRVRYENAWREFVAYVGCPDMPAAPLGGRLEQDRPTLAWAPALDRLLRESPEMAVAALQVRRQQRTVRREELEPIPDLIVRGGAYYSLPNNEPFYEFRTYIDLPIWNRNQGNIYTARHALTDVRRDHERVRLQLQERLARAFTRYNSSRANVAMYRDRILPTARRAFELYLEQFRDEDESYSRVGSAQGAYFEAYVEYVEALLELRRVEAAIDGYLLTETEIGPGELRPDVGGLAVPPAGGGAPVGRPTRGVQP